MDGLQTHNAHQAANTMASRSIDWIIHDETDISWQRLVKPNHDQEARPALD